MLSHGKAEGVDLSRGILQEFERCPSNEKARHITPPNLLNLGGFTVLTAGFRTGTVAEPIPSRGGYRLRECQTHRTGGQ